MKILHAAETIKGGVATVMRTLALAQSDENTVRCLIPADQSKELAPFRNLRTFTRTGRNPLSFLSFSWNLAKTVITFRPHVVHLHSTFAGVFGRIVLALLWPVVRPKVIYMPHAWAFIMDGSPRKKNLYATIEKLLYPFTSKVVCVSKFEAAEATRFGLPNHKTAIVPPLRRKKSPTPTTPNASTCCSPAG
jgi:Glycosyltransferase Family 4